MDDEEAIAFLKVRNQSLDVKLQVLKIGTGLVRAAVLVHSRGSLCEVLNTLLLRTTLFRSPISDGGQCHDASHRRMAGLLSVRYLLSSLAALVQLDRLRAYDKLPSDVCVLKRDGHCTRCQHLLPSHVFHQKSPHELGTEDWDKQHLWARHLVSLPNRRPRASGFRLKRWR